MTRKCDDTYDWFSYFRIGLYYVTKRGERINFCDVHFGSMPSEIMERGVYSGPKDSAKDTTRKERSKEAKERYFREGWVHPSLDLSAGGLATALHDRKLSVTDVWLLGPLQYEGGYYGSVVARLKGFEYPKAQRTDLRDHSLPEDSAEYAKQRTDPTLQRFKLVVPKGWGSKFMPCTMWGGDYSEGTRPLPTDRAEKISPSLNKALGAARERLRPATLPKDVMKVVWKIEEHKEELTACTVFDGKG